MASVWALIAKKAKTWGKLDKKKRKKNRKKRRFRARKKRWSFTALLSSCDCLEAYTLPDRRSSLGKHGRKGGDARGVTTKQRKSTQTRQKGRNRKLTSISIAKKHDVGKGENGKRGKKVMVSLSRTSYFRDGDETGSLYTVLRVSNNRSKQRGRLCGTS